MKRAFLIILIPLLIGIGSACASTLRVHFISVGHGDAILIELEGRALALVDAGSAQTGPPLLEYLRKQGFSGISHLFATHNHQDHIGAVPMILDSLKVDTVHVTGMTDDWEEAKALTRYLQTGRWAVDTTDAGETPIQRGDFRIEVLSPTAEETAGKMVDCNAHSMVLLLTHGDVKMLLGADINQGREEWLIEGYGSRLACQVLKASHHGSWAGNCEAYLQAVKPELTVVCIGPNGWGYPSAETVQRIREHCPTLLRTDLDGTVVVQSDGDKFQVVSPVKAEP